MLGFATELRDNLERFAQTEIVELVSLLAAQSAEASDIVEDLLVACRADAGVLVIDATWVDLAEEIGRVVGVNRESKAPPIPLPKSEIMAWADPLRVRQMIRNLYSNAQRYGGPTIRVTMELVDDEAVVSVSDDGPGIPRAERDNIFDAFTQASTNVHQPGSIGLGLTVARTLAEAMGGSLTYSYARKVKASFDWLCRLPSQSWIEHAPPALTVPTIQRRNASSRALAKDRS